MSTHPTPITPTGRPQATLGLDHISAANRRLAAGALVILSAFLVVLGITAPAGADTRSTTDRSGAQQLAVESDERLISATSSFASTGDDDSWTTIDQLAGEILVRTGGQKQTVGVLADGIGDLAPLGGGAASVDADCFVDFDDDLVLQYLIPDAAENTFMTAPWYQACNDWDYYPAIAVKPMDYGHFHLGYEDDRVGPCGGDLTDWGRHQNPPPADDDDYAAWIQEDCVADIDPITEPRSGIMPHWTGHRAKIQAYEGHTDTTYLPFQLKTLQVTGGSVEVCRLPPDLGFTIGGAGSAWQCTVVGEGYWNLSNIVGPAIEVQVEFLDTGIVLDNIGIDIL